MSEERLRNLEHQLHAMRKSSEEHHQDMRDLMVKVEETLRQLAVVIAAQDTFKQELLSTRKNSHDALNAVAKLPMLEQRVSKLEAHEDAREAELKESFSKRDEKMSKASEDCHTRINNLSRIVYIGMGIAIALQAFFALLLKKAL